MASVIISIAPISKSLAVRPRFVADAGVPEVTWNESEQLSTAIT
ncbi:hypothetical protein [Synechococcus sp. CS-602]|nr:hypothetical protein [Synechococcus sp. CS-602]MCT4367165.1 hypothetical protein [Candidatus Regnicoccus frigidus MAG-AL2]